VLPCVDPARKYRQRAPITIIDNIVCGESTRITSICDELFVVVDRRPRGQLLIDVYDTPSESPVIDEYPADADPVGPGVFKPTIQATGHVTEDIIRDTTNRWSRPSKTIGLSASRSRSMSDLAEAAAGGMFQAEDDMDVDWFHDLYDRHDTADLVRQMTVNPATVDTAQMIDIIKVSA